MRKFYQLSLVMLCLLGSSFESFAQNNFFEAVNKTKIADLPGKRMLIPEKYSTVSLDNAKLKTFLWSLPAEKTVRIDRSNAPIMTFPMPDGSSARFRVWESSIQEPGLEAKFPEIKTFAGQGIDDPFATMRFDYNPYNGFHVQILSAATGRIYIDPFAKGNIENYISYFHADNHRASNFRCLADDTEFLSNHPELLARPGEVLAGPCRGTSLQTYRLAVSCTGEYSQVVGGGLPGPTHAVIVTSTNRVTGVYEVELAIRLMLIATNNLIEYTDPATDPFTNVISTATLNTNQTNTDAVIGFANYDIGHHYTSDDNGVAQLGSVCGTGKARGATGAQILIGDGYDIDYVAHEMGHQFGAGHTFNSATCASSGVGGYEPGGGTTILAYAGICASTENIQPFSDPIFHARSFDQISTFLSSGAGGSCGVATATGNTLPVITSMSNNNVSIPISTPFTLTGTATDANGDALTYNWEGWDVGSTAGTWISAATSTNRPLFRTRLSKTTGSRTFPDIRVIAANYPGTAAPSAMDGLRGEVLPTVARVMKFRLTVRDNRAGGGGVVSGGDGCQLIPVFQVNAVATPGPFAVTVPNGGESYASGSTQTITWDVVGTNAAPFNVTDVKISLSTDGGLTYPTVLIASTPNDGSQALVIPGPVTTTARVKVEAIGNIFFDISNANFAITAAAGPSIALTSAPTTTSQTLCIGAQIQPITYSTAGGVTGATVSGLPAGVTGTYSGGTNGTFTITGFPTVAGVFNYTVTGTGGGGSPTAAGTITVNPNVTLTLTSAAATTTQTVNINTAITNITYSTGNGATGATVTGLPAGVTGTYSGGTNGTVTISGTPTASGTFPYTVTTSGGCSNASLTGTITVNLVPAITLSSAAGTNNQIRCINSAITNITYATSGGVTGATVTGLPAGVTGTYSGGTNGTVTISGTPTATGTFNYTVTTSGGGGPASATGTILVNGVSVITLTSAAATSNQAVNINTPITNITYSTTNGVTGATVTGLPAGVTGTYSGGTNGTVTISGTPTASGVFNYTVSITGGCGTPTATGTITVNLVPSITLSSGPGSNTPCVGINTAMANITYTTAGGVTGATVAGLPAGVTGTYSGGTNGTVTISGTPTAGGTYNYTVTTSGGISPATATGTITVGTVASITTQPTAQTVCAPVAAIFTAVAGGAGSTYQWQVSTTGIGGPYTNVTTGTGGQSQSYNTGATNVAMSGNYYHLVVTNSCNTVTSNNVLLTVNAPAIITTQPTNQSACTGNTATFTVAATGTGVTYQWQSAPAVGGPFTNVTTGTGGQTNTYTTGVITAGTNRFYQVNVMTILCPSTIASNVVQLTINTVSTIAGQPISQTVCAGSPATFTVAAAGTGNSFQWQVSPTGVGGPFSNVTTGTGGLTNSYNTGATTAAMNGAAYQVIVTGTCNPVTSSIVTLTVNTAAAITTQPTPQTVCTGSTATFTVTGTGAGATYQWRSGPTATGPFTNVTTGTGGTTNTYTTAPTTAAMNGTYYQVRVTTTTCAGTATSNAVLLTVNTTATINTQPQPQSVCLPGTGTFTVGATGTGLGYIWQVSTNGGTSFSDIPGATGASYTTPPVTVAMNGNLYQVLVSSTCAPGSPITSNAVLLSVNNPVSVTQNPTDQRGCVGENFTFSVVAAPPTGINYQWQVSTNGGTSYTNVPGPGGNASSYTITNAPISVNGNLYRVIVSGGICGQVITPGALLTVGFKPTVVLTPAAASSLNPSINSGLFATVSPVGNYIYNWTKNGVQIPNTLASTSIPLNVDNFGSYQVFVLDVATGCGAASNIVRIDSLVSNHLFIYPNPVSTSMQVRYYNANPAVRNTMLNVFDSKGARVIAQNYTISGTYGRMDVDMSKLIPGTYNVELRDASGKKVAGASVIKGL